jgi:hypothetical protein
VKKVKACAIQAQRPQLEAKKLSAPSNQASAEATSARQLVSTFAS